MLILHCVLSLSCVCDFFLIRHVCASTWCLTWYQSGRLLALLQIEWAICVYGLCISAKILEIFVALRVSAVEIFPHSECGFGEGATFRNWQHSGIGFEERQHCPSEGFHSNFSLQFLLIKMCNLKSCWILFILGF